ncbi:hypothetical protein EYS09_07980 [Streptomyces kasugaensis]|uniref:Uncharacterized protein n=1 Tax=Streptomyces kasugaensis TaxID=1946 RepID=A0A4Q9HYR2_STRKA|nr:hypothetical protein [Streptomyces kasugaensis]TBO60225.1 hypothetical protein EYS09_07980 [Streptomyces kasugaensis]
MFAFLFTRRSCRLRHLRRLAAATGPATRTRLPDGSQPANSPVPYPVAAGPAAPDTEEQRVRGWLHDDQHGRTDTTTSSDDDGAGGRR